MPSTLRTILAATDLGDGSDAIVHSAGLLAARTGAELHLLHSLDLPWDPSEDVKRRSGFFGLIESAKERLQAQAGRAVPEGVRVATANVIIYVAHKAILDRAEEISADLIVVGPHRGGEPGAHFLGTTADRVVRTAEVPCLVVGEPLAEGVQRIGVPIDFSDPSQGALESALGWGLQMAAHPDGGSGTAPEIRVLHVGWSVEKADNPDLEERTIRPELERHIRRARGCVPGAQSLHVPVDVLWANEPVEATTRWVEDAGIHLLVMGTHGRSGLKRALLGSVASGVARRAPCPVLLVPPSLWSGQAHAPALDRVLIATDFSEPALEAARWATGDLAPGAEHLLVHVLEVPEPPAVLAGRFGAREELLRTASEGAAGRLAELRDALSDPTRAAGGTLRTEVLQGHPAEELALLAEDFDLVVMGEHGRSEVKRGAWTMLGSTVERVLRSSPAPVLVVRGKPRGSPRHLLVAVDGSDASLRALVWAGFLSGRFGADLSVIHVERPIAYGYAALEQAEERTLRRAERREWLRAQVRRAGLDPETVAAHAVEGRLAEEIVAMGERTGADLISLGTRGQNLVGRALMGSVSGGVLRTAPCSVLVVGDPPQPRR